MNNSDRTICEEGYEIPKTKEETDEQDGFKAESEEKDEREVKTHPDKR